MYDQILTRVTGQDKAYQLCNYNKTRLDTYHRERTGLNLRAIESQPNVVRHRSWGQDKMTLTIYSITSKQNQRMIGTGKDKTYTLFN